MVELRALFMLLRASARWLAAGALVGVVIGTAAAAWQAAHPSATILVSLRAGAMEAAPDGAVSYDGYYRIETERRFGSILGEVLRRADVAAALFRETGVAIGRIERISPLDYRATLRGQRATEPLAAEMLAREAGTAFARAREATGEPLSADVAVSLVQSNTPMGAVRSAFAGGLIGFILGAVGILLRHYFRSAGHEGFVGEGR